MASPTAAGEPPKVVATIKPLYGLAAAVMAGIAEPQVLVKGAASPHAYALRPSDARALQEADVIVWVGPLLERFLERPLASLASDSRVVTASEIPGLTLLPAREGGVWNAHDAHHHDREHENGAHGAERSRNDDAHIWLDPDNAREIVGAVAKALSAADPANAATYEHNAQAMRGRIDALDRKLAALLAPVRERPFLVFHDAYQYFEHHYGLAAAGSITIAPDRKPSARRLSEIRGKLHSLGATCVFREPQFEPGLVRTAVEGTGARIGVLDPLGAGLAADSDSYLHLMRDLARSLRDCLDR